MDSCLCSLSLKVSLPPCLLLSLPYFICVYVCVHVCVYMCAQNILNPEPKVFGLVWMGGREEIQIKFQFTTTKYLLSI